MGLRETLTAGLAAAALTTGAMAGGTEVKVNPRDLIAQCPTADTADTVAASAVTTQAQRLQDAINQALILPKKEKDVLELQAEALIAEIQKIAPDSRLSTMEAELTRLGEVNITETSKLMEGMARLAALELELGTYSKAYQIVLNADGTPLVLTPDPVAARQGALRQSVTAKQGSLVCPPEVIEYVVNNAGQFPTADLDLTPKKTEEAQKAKPAQEAPVVPVLDAKQARIDYMGRLFSVQTALAEVKQKRAAVGEFAATYIND